MGTELIWKQALCRSESALAASALVPLPTSVHALTHLDGVDFELRHLTGAAPKHLRAAGPRPNPSFRGINGWRSVRWESTTP